MEKIKKDISKEVIIILLESYEECSRHKVASESSLAPPLKNIKKENVEKTNNGKKNKVIIEVLHMSDFH